MGRRWVVCRVCGEGFSPRIPQQDVCGLQCFCRDRRHLVGWPTRSRHALRRDAGRANVALELLDRRRILGYELRT
jgi:hypothetical protein